MHQVKTAQSQSWGIDGRLIYRSDRAPLLFCLLIVLTAALLVRVLPLLIWPSISRPDEIFQALEPAHRLVTGFGIVSWEWREGIRSWFFPGCIAGLMMVGHALGFGTSGTLTVVATGMALTSLFPVIVAFAAGHRLSGLPGGVLAGGLCALWPDLAFYGARTLTEAQSAHLLILAAGLTALAPRSASHRETRLSLVIGVLLALTIAIRIQLAPAVILVAAWRCRLDRTVWMALLAGAAGPLLGLGLLDWCTLGTPFQSLWKYAYVNVVQGRSLQYGVSPAWWYGGALVRNWQIATLPMCLCFIAGIRRQPLFAAIAAVVIASHSALGHKEATFIYAAVAAILIVAGCGCCDILLLVARTLHRPLPGIFWLGGLTWAALAVSVAMSPAWQDRWAPSGRVWVESAARERPDLCGMGFYKWAWEGTGGYTYLDRPVPIVLIDGPRELRLTTAAINYVLAPVGVDVPGFPSAVCRYGSCLLHREGSCVGPDLFSTTTDLIRRGE